ncbi:hypothetical protein HBP70_11005, partial [Listeria welshimeri]|nr:hypothetical protein [Listeria welshimeri]
MKKIYQKTFLLVVIFCVVGTMMSSYFPTEAAEKTNEEAANTTQETAKENVTSSSVDELKEEKNLQQAEEVSQVSKNNSIETVDEKAPIVDQEESKEKESKKSLNTPKTRVNVAATVAPPAMINQIFPDANLAENIRTLLNKSSVSEVVTQAELDGINTINIRNNNVSSLEGLQYLQNLSYANLGANPYSDIQPIIQLKNVQTLYLDRNPNMQSIDGLQNLTSLKFLEVTDTVFSDLSPIASLKNLQDFRIANSTISDYSSVSNLTNLTQLVIDKSQFNDMTLVSNLVKLKTLTLMRGKIKNITGLENLTNLTNLNLYGNQIRDISALKKLDNPNLKLDVSSQSITNSPIDYISTMIEVENSIRDVENISVAPTIISNNGSYDGDSNKVTWPMPSYLASVNYTFSKTFTFGGQNAIFSGRVIQPLNRVSFIATFDVDGKTSSETVAYNNAVPQPADPVKAGYTFKGWYTTKTGGDKWDFVNDKMPARDITLYAQFTVNSYQATFDVDGKTSSETVAYNNAVPQPADPVKAGYT